MSCSIENNSGQDMSALTGLAKKFYPYAQEYLGFDKPARIVYETDATNGQDPLGKTAMYNPSNYTVTLFVDGRHPKDMLRSLAHELVHHAQNCRGDLCPEKMGEAGDGYAQNNEHLRKMEQEAYASMVMRDWEDQHKSKRRKNLQETNYINKEIYTMSEHEKLIRAIVTEVMKQATITTEADKEEDEDVQEEGQGDRNDKDREQGRASSDRRQGTSSGGGAGQNLEEADDDTEVKEEGKYKRDDDEKKETSSREDAQQKCAKEKKTWNTAKAKCEPKVKEESASPDVSQHRNAGQTDTIEESDDESEDDKDNLKDLKETFQRRQEKLFERLSKWSKQ